MKKAVFLDRDGVINPLVYNLNTKEYESPHFIEDFSIFPYVAKSLKRLINIKFELFLVTNQPSYAKGKTTLENIKGIHRNLDLFFKEENIHFTHYYYCFHHPNGIIPEYSFTCNCRKPKSQSLLNAAKDFNVELRDSWFIGDQDSDIECGNSQGLKTILVENKHSVAKRGKSCPDFLALNLQTAVEIIIESYNK